MSKSMIKPATALAWLLWAIVVVGSLLDLPLLVERNPVPGSILRVVVNILWTILPLVFVTVGALIVSNQSRNVIGWLLTLPGLTMLLDPLVSASISGITQPPANPSFWLIALVWLSNAGWVLLIFPVIFIAMLFPTGAPPSPRWRWVVYYGIGLIVLFLVLAMFLQEVGPDPQTYGVDWTIKNPIGFIPEDVLEAIFFPWWAIALASLTLLALAALVVRFRRAGTVERQQIKWLLYVCALFVLVYVPLAPLQGSPEGLVGEVTNLALGLALNGFPIAIGIAILRHRLFDIDIIIRRTLTYALVTGTLVLVFFGSVIVLQQIFASVTGSRQNELVTVLSTLTIAGLFLPLRNRVQGAIDRRFNRRKYDAQQVLAQFAARARDETDLGKLTDKLIEVLNETMQPERLDVRLVQGKKKESRA